MTIAHPPGDSHFASPRLISPLFGEPLRQGFALARVELGQDRELLFGTTELSLAEQAFRSREHSCETEERIESERLARLSKSPVPVARLEQDMGQALMKYRRPGIERDSPLGWFQRGLDVSFVDRIRQALAECLFVRRGQSQCRLDQPKCLRAAS